MTIRGFILTILLCLCSFSISFSQEQPTIYLFPGQGSDERLFDSLKFENHQKIVHIKYPIPKKGSSLPEYAKGISEQIDTTQHFILIGVSLGGMIITELKEYLNPEKSIIISSAKSRSELPSRYRFQKAIPLYKIVPPKLMLAGAKFLQPIVEPDRNTNKATFKRMLASKDPIYMKRTVEMIIKWERENPQENIIHIHGTKDHTIPIRNVEPTHIIEDGSHMMTLTQSSPINKILSEYLNE
ncbi:alpha/beta hydrolase [Marivirga salinae]|uniref:Alpha/beta hydrolase n=1 Tax=Marivirga salinarum TaxID=3059078 RepID=A0AA51N959_9BACT|nr:alpha/beta hydrolase [Marivirga sp. BDSF4-3]WMN10888.1 alpha/beta hydrolase [Marivirga sp. BDSF4-3]